MSDEKKPMAKRSSSRSGAGAEKKKPESWSVGTYHRAPTLEELEGRSGERKGMAPVLDLQNLPEDPAQVAGRSLRKKNKKTR